MEIINEGAVANSNGTVTITPTTETRANRFFNGPQPDMVFADELFSTANAPTDILWLLLDQQNTVTDVATMSSTSGTATLRNHLEYNVFGEITSQTNATYQPRQTYTGQILDPVTGLLYYDARWYDPKLGRFISEDPIGFSAGDANLFRYVGNSMPNWVDPTGLQYGGYGRASQAAMEAERARIRVQREFLNAVARAKQAQQMIQLRLARVAELIAEVQKACGSPELEAQIALNIDQMVDLVEEYDASYSRAKQLAASNYGRDLGPDQMQAYFGIPALPLGFGTPEYDDDQRSLDDAIDRGRQEADDALEIAEAIDTWNNRAGLALGVGAIVAGGIRIGMTEGGKAAAKYVGRVSAASAVGAAAGYAQDKGVETACRTFGLSPQTQVYVAQVTTVVVAIVAKRRAGRAAPADADRIAEQRQRRASRRERDSRIENGQNQTGDGFRDHQSANMGPRGIRPSGDTSKNRERNIGIDEEHSRVAKGTGGQRGNRR